MKANRTLLSLLAASLPLLPLAAAQLGDPAAPLHIAEWVKGRPVDLAKAKGKQIVVVEFWATWCPPCRTSIPHLTELQKKFGPKGVVFVGITDEEPSVVKPFVKKMGDQMNYTVAIDKDRQTGKGYMEAYGQNGIPCAFVVDRESRVVWVGHPMGELEQVLDQLLAGKYDLAAAKARQKGRQLLETFFTELNAEKPDEAQLRRLAEQIVAINNDTGGSLLARRFTVDELMQQARAGILLQRYQEAALKGADDAKLAALEAEIRPQLPADVDFDAIKRSLLAMRDLNAYFEAAAQGDKTKADALKEGLYDRLKDDPQALNTLAWTIATEEAIQHRDLDLARKAAERAVRLTKQQNPGIIDTLARVLFEQGRYQEAISWQEKAIQAHGDGDPGLKAQLQQTLDRYKAKAAEKAR